MASLSSSDFTPLAVIVGYVITVIIVLPLLLLLHPYLLAIPVVAFIMVALRFERKETWVKEPTEIRPMVEVLQDLVDNYGYGH